VRLGQSEEFRNNVIPFLIQCQCTPVVMEHAALICESHDKARVSNGFALILMLVLQAFRFAFDAHGSSYNRASQLANEQSTGDGHYPGINRQATCVVPWISVSALLQKTARQTRFGFCIKEEGDFRSRLLLAWT
jgi:hypothetical protein